MWEGQRKVERRSRRMEGNKGWRRRERGRGRERGGKEGLASVHHPRGRHDWTIALHLVHKSASWPPHCHLPPLLLNPSSITPSLLRSVISALKVHHFFLLRALVSPLC